MFSLRCFSVGKNISEKFWSQKFHFTSPLKFGAVGRGYCPQACVSAHFWCAAISVTRKSVFVPVPGVLVIPTRFWSRKLQFASPWGLGRLGCPQAPVLSRDFCCRYFIGEGGFCLGAVEILCGLSRFPVP